MTRKTTARLEVAQELAKDKARASRTTNAPKTTSDSLSPGTRIRKSKAPQASPAKTPHATTRKPTPNPAKAAKPTQASKSNPGAKDSSTLQSRLISTLQQKQGATLEQLMQLSGWQAHSVRGFISGVLRKKLGLLVERQSSENGVLYRIAAPLAALANEGGVQ